MNSKERMFNVLQGKETDVMPVGLHAWGLYKFQLAEVISGYEEEDKAWSISGKELADVESNYYETFKPDFLHLSEVPGILPKHKMQQPQYKELMEELQRMESKKIIDTFVEKCYPDPEEYFQEERFDHVRILSERYGDDVFIAFHSATPVNSIFDPEGFLGGFEEAMITAREKPEMMAYLIYESHKKHLDYHRALVSYKPHAYISTEAYLSSDLVSPSMYKNLLFETQKKYYSEIKKIGLIPIMCFWGNINPIVEYFKEIDIDGLMVEESRKGYTLDVAEIKKKLDNKITVFGNISSENTLLYGTPEEVRRKTRNQIESLNNKKRFIVCSGSPIAFDTPEENIRTMIDTARQF